MSRFYSILLFTSLFAFAIRSFHSDTLPLYIDEVSIGYNAYSILTTGKDEHGISTPLFFRAFGEYKLPVYIYATGLSQLFLGKTDAAVRLPSILAGTFAVFFLALFIRLLSKNAILSLLSAFILAITPWHIQFSRAGFEANVALSLVLIGSYFLIKEIMRKRFSFLGLFFMILSLYTYNAERVFVPLFLIAIWQILYKRVTSGRLARRSPDVIGTNAGPANVRILMLCLMVFSIILLPILSFSFSPEGMIRASSESFTKDVRVQVEDFFQSVPIHTLQQFLKNYLSNFSLDFLFFSGDGNGRHGVREMGLLYLWQLPFIVVGIVNLIKKAGDASPAMAGRATGLRLPKHMLRPAKAGPAAIQNIMMLWLLLSPLASSLTRPNPHALRSLLMVIPLAYFTAVGILSMKYYVLSIRYYVAGIKHFVLHRSWLTLTPAERDKVFFVLCYLLFVVCSLLFVICYLLFDFLHIYFVHYPKRAAPDWSSGIKEVAVYVTQKEHDYSRILLTDTWYNAFLFLQYYGNRTPAQNLALVSPNRFGQYELVGSPLTHDLEPHTLYIAPYWEERKERVIKEFRDASGAILFRIWEN